MESDQSAPLPPAPAPDWELPEIVDVKIRQASFRPHKPHNFDSPLEAVKNAVEIVVTLESPMPIRALGPVLYVGNAQLTESEAVDKDGKQLRFWGLDREMLADGAPISMGWMGDRRQKRKTKFAFREPR
jgi:hypothetical protein